VPGRSPIYCSEVSRRVDEQAFGTASIGNLWFLLEYSLAWERKAVEDSLLSTRVKGFLEDLVKTLPRARILLIKTDRLRTKDLSFYVVRSSERAPFQIKFQLSNYEELLELDIASIAAGNAASRGELITSPLFLVCTHGRRDKCCAKFGYPLYKSLRASVDDTVWQSSHVGGDRFAANLVCLPHGLFYAHVTDESGHEIIKEYRTGRVVLDKYRGRACYSHPVQAAEFFVRVETGLTGIDDIRHIRTERVDATSWRVLFEKAETETIYVADVKTRVSDFQNYITCDAVEEKSVRLFELEDLRIGA
jgi:hypothetical protein